MSLTETRDELIDSIQGNLSGLTLPIAMADIGDELAEAADRLGALGICNLLIYADTDRFYENLVRSGHTRRYFLKKCRDEADSTNWQLAISRWDSFLDVLATGNFALARDISTLSITQWMPGSEYEDDFCYRYFLHRFIMPPEPIRDLQLNEALDRWRRWLGVQASPRAQCCEALFQRDSVRFASSFDELLSMRQAQIVVEKKMPLAGDVGFVPRSEVFVEGLALLRLAERLGFELRDDYPMCPGIARLRPGKPFPDDMFPEIEAARGQS